MNDLVKEYNFWLKDNQNIIIHLKKHDSSLYNRVMPLYEVLNFLSIKLKENDSNFNQDIVKIYQVGLEYLHNQVDTIKLYLEKSFNGDFHNFLHYDKVVGYILFLEDLRYEIQENKVETDSLVLNNLMKYLETILDKKEGIPDNINLYIDSEIHKAIDITKFNFNSIIDIFVEIAETLEIDLESNEDYVIGKDI